MNQGIRSPAPGRRFNLTRCYLIRPNELGLAVGDENVGLGHGLVSPWSAAGGDTASMVRASGGSRWVPPKGQITERCREGVPARNVPSNGEVRP